MVRRREARWPTRFSCRHNLRGSRTPWAGRLNSDDREGDLFRAGFALLHRTAGSGIRERLCAEGRAERIESAKGPEGRRRGWANGANSGCPQHRGRRAAPMSSHRQKPQGDFVGRPLAGAFAERAQARGLRPAKSSGLDGTTKDGNGARIVLRSGTGARCRRPGGLTPHHRDGAAGARRIGEGRRGPLGRGARGPLGCARPTQPHPQS